MSERDISEKERELEDGILPGAGVGGQIVVPADDSIFGPAEEPAENDQGTNEEDISSEDDELLDPGASPEFDHSLHRRKNS